MSKINWIKELSSPKMINCAFNGFSAGLPLYFLLQLVPAWLRNEGIDLKTIGFFGLVLLPFSFKYLWAPILDNIRLPFLSRRRGWMLVCQVAICLTMVSLASLNAKLNINLIIVICSLIGFFSATQDIALDAYRREILTDKELGLGNSYYANAYRVSGFIPGGLGLILADYVSWSATLLVISAFMAVSILYTFIVSESVDDKVEKKPSFKSAVFDPFIEFFTRDGFKEGSYILLFIFFYKFGDTVATSLITPFYLDVGFTNAQLGSVVKVVSLWAMLVGGFVGGTIMLKIGINKALWIFGFVQMFSILGFALLSEVGNNLVVLTVVVAFEYLGVGLGSAALMAYIAKKTNKNFTGTQLALLTSLFNIPKSFAGIMSGVMIDGVSDSDGYFYTLLGNISGLGYTNYFIICTFFAIPGMILLFKVAPWSEKD